MLANIAISKKLQKRIKIIEVVVVSLVLQPLDFL
jgi:hypothetical protein